jgi:hypothetical protein
MLRSHSCLKINQIYGNDVQPPTKLYWPLEHYGHP